jgi:hypothetical protein
MKAAILGTARLSIRIALSVLAAALACVQTPQKMKTRLSAFCAVALLAVAALGQTGGTRSARERLVGGWRLISMEQQDAGPNARKVECCGLFVFTNDGHLSVQVMRREPEGQGAAASGQYSRGGYEATYGTYAVDERSHTFTFHVEGSLVADLVGKDLPRRYQFSGKQLIVTSTDSNEHWKATWEHY